MGMSMAEETEGEKLMKLFRPKKEAAKAPRRGGLGLPPPAFDLSELEALDETEGEDDEGQQDGLAELQARFARLEEQDDV